MDIQKLIDELRDAAYETGYYAGKIEQEPRNREAYAPIQSQAIERRRSIYNALTATIERVQKELEFQIEVNNLWEEKYKELYQRIREVQVALKDEK